MRLDLHTHSKYSPDGAAEIADMLGLVHKLQFDGIAVTDHNTLTGSLAAAKADTPLLVIPGVEISTIEGHMLALGITEPVPRGLSAVETAEKVRDLGGVPVAAHPWRLHTGMGPRPILDAKLDAIETFNGRTWGRHNLRAVGFARERSLGQTGGSDAHRLDELGRGWVELPDQHEDVDSVLEALRKRGGQGLGLQRPRRHVVAVASRNVSRWVGRRGRYL